AAKRGVHVIISRPSHPANLAGSAGNAKEFFLMFPAHFHLPARLAPRDWKAKIIIRLPQKNSCLSPALTFPKCEKFHNLFLLRFGPGAKHGSRAKWILVFC